MHARERGSLEGHLRHDTGSAEFRAIKRAIARANGGRERAVENVCRRYHVRALDALPAGILSMARFIAKL